MDNKYIYILFFGLGVATTVLFFHNQQPTDQTTHSVRAGGFKFTNPLLECEAAENTFVELKPFKKKIQAFVDDANEKSNHIDFVSLYFRDLNNGPWFGVNEKATFSPASLLKVPLMMAYYKMSETQPDILKQKYTITQDNIKQIVPNSQTIIPSQRLEIGKDYTTDELIEHMILYSDNDSAQLLISHMDLSELVKTYQDFGIELPDTDPLGTKIDIKTYAGLFRILFNASYLNPANSEKALNLLSRVGFKDGLVAGVPDGISVSHKFGERVGPGDEKQLHDCGIVYYPNHPYLLCIMTKGDSLDELTGLVRDTSQQVYNEVDGQYGGK